MLLSCDPSKKTVSRVRCSHLAGLLSAIERKRVCGKFVTPKAIFELSKQDFGLLRQITRPRIVAKELGQFRRRQLGGINVALHFAQSDWPFGRRTVRVENRILRILPALMDETELRSASIFHEAVTVGIAVTINPSQSPLDVRPNRLNERAVTCALVVGAGKHDEKRR